MTIEEAIEHCNEVATELARNCQECAAEHIQLSEWLTELKQRREAEITAPPKSNGDHIRHMTDEELAENISFIDCSKCPLYNMHCGGRCRDKFLEWLKQEVIKDDER